MRIALLYSMATSPAAHFLEVWLAKRGHQVTGVHRGGPWQGEVNLAIHVGPLQDDEIVTVEPRPEHVIGLWSGFAAGRPRGQAETAADQWFHGRLALQARIIEIEQEAP
jgi:hypothetical protein